MTRRLLTLAGQAMIALAGLVLLVALMVWGGGQP